eukprot:CAMPEP_0202347866 /NCGR_PEP_ID=MMETSP1126-20121109/6050_1 /ASSEMBLY_ACC=CAM_ASM_000457 /TAXON_ID=3047 /ORGANISM="Dunaliella tertiolecta, Strain CCMP1320" /LENGTH=319 /DNA_ID=CAMNT_0048939489 /DNA_START=258 /DNA_END=1217 /DNA_ORIENTATION=-
MATDANTTHDNGTTKEEPAQASIREENQQQRMEGQLSQGEETQQQVEGQHQGERKQMVAEGEQQQQQQQQQPVGQQRDGTSHEDNTLVQQQQQQQQLEPQQSRVETQQHQKHPNQDAFQSRLDELQLQQVSGPLGIRFLRFYSSWEETPEDGDLTLRVGSDSHVGGGLRARKAKLQFDLLTGRFSFRMEANGQALGMDNIVALNAGSGKPCDAWDLHVGATILILGRPMALKSADCATAQWIEHHASLMRQTKQELLVELQKYKPRAHSASVSHNRGSKVTGGLSLRHLAKQLDHLIQDLMQYRPKKAQELASRLEIGL